MLKRILFGASIIFPALLYALPILSAEPPDLLNYQGVLRDASDAPLDGDHDTVFRFWSHETGGDEILIDTHDTANANPVSVSGGLFNVELGGGAVSDGSGPGAYVTLRHVFRDYGDVWLEITVEGETLSPRVRILSAAYAINADHLDGITSENFLRSNESDSFTFGTLTLAGGTSLQVDGSMTKATSDLVSNFNADLLDGLHSTDFAGASHTHAGSDITSAVSEASNADTLDGNDSSYFINTSSTSQTKSGPLNVDASAVPGQYGVQVYGPEGGGYFEDSDESGYAEVGSGNIGVRGFGTQMGGYFADSDNSGYAYLGYGEAGIRAVGNEYGGRFYTINAGNYAYLAYDNHGVYAFGNEVGGYFRDNNDTGSTYVGYGDYGVHATGGTAGGYFRSHYFTNVEAYLGHGHIGISAYGDEAGGYFEQVGGTGLARLAYSNTGIDASGDTGGSFAETDALSTAVVASGGTGVEAQGVNAGARFTHISTLPSDVYIATDTHGINASGNTYGGYFTGSGSEAWLGTPDAGINASGWLAGGTFSDMDDSAWANVAAGDIGIEAYGTYVGGYFSDSDGTGNAHVGYGEFGIDARGYEAGGYFEDSNGSSIVWVGRNDNGISSYGNLMGGYFEDSDNGTVTRIAYGGYGIDSTGTKNFVQNHPYEKDKVVVYSSLEGDEVGTYTRGTARLENGVATVPLGETFRWVTHPDIGLTVHLTPVGEWSDLYVVEKSTDEIVVGSRDGAPDAAFDYIVLGLRIGFEETPPLRKKDGEAYIPSMAAVRRRYDENPDLRRFNALERFKKMRAAASGGEDPELDMTAAQELREAIQEYDPVVHGPLTERRPQERPRPGKTVSREQEQVPSPVTPESESPKELTAAAVADPAEETTAGLPNDATLFPVLEPVEPGDLLALDPEHPGYLRPAAAVADPAVIGVASADPIHIDGLLHVPVSGSGFSVIKVDAGYGTVRAGDLLMSSPTPGHAMVALEPAPGVILGKALEPLEQGTGLIKVLVNIR